VICLLLGAGAAPAQGVRDHSLLLFPIHSHWLSEPLAEAVSAALSDTLSQAGYAVAEVRKDSPVVQLAVSEGWVSPEVLKSGALEEQRQALGVAVRAQASLRGRLVETELETQLLLTAGGTVSEREAGLDVRVPRGEERDAVVRELVEATRARLTPEFWSELGVGRTEEAAAAAARYASGREAMAAGMYREACPS
jgi:hypothetical protein